MDLAIRHIKDLLSDGYLLLADDFNIIEFNQQAATLFPWLDSHTIGQDYFTLVRDKQIAAPVDRETIENIRLDETLKLTQRLKYSEKTEQSIDWTITKIEADKQYYYCLIGQSIIPEKENESYFQGARSTLRQIIDSAPGIMYLKDKDGYYLGCNNELLKATGYKSVEEVIGLTDKDMPWSQYYEKYRQDDLAVLRTGEALYDIDDYIMYTDGVQQQCITNKVPLFDNNGDVYGVLGVATEITKRKQTEEALRLAKEEIEMVSKAKNEFILNLSHDLLVPLYEILGMQDMALMAVEEAKVTLGSSNISLADLQSALSILISHIEESQIAARTSTDRLLELYHTSSGYLTRA